jgi:Pro-kumamolisin, activation domain
MLMEPGVEAAKSAQVVGRVDPGRTMTLTLGLPLRNKAELSLLLKNVYDPSNPQYRHFPSRAEFARRFGPTDADVAAAAQFARTNGLAITGITGGRTLMKVRGTAARIESAFGITLQTYKHPTEDRRFFAAANAPRVPEGTPILDVSGLNDYSRPRSHRRFGEPAGGVAPKAGGSAANGGYTAKDIRAAYATGVPWRGDGQSVALVEFDGFYTNDIAKYRAACGIPNVPLKTVLIDGYDGKPTTGAGSGNGEVALDIQMCMAMAPNLSQIVVYEGSQASAPNDMLGAMIEDGYAFQISCSWDFGSGPADATDQLFQQMAALGMSYFNASGDTGAYSTAIPVPDDSPYITLVGGVTLTTAGAGGVRTAERVWNAGNDTSSGGGISTTYPIPAWQTGVNMASNGGSTLMRNLPDAAWLGDNVFTVADNGKNELSSGTSVAAPLWAGLAALINEKAASLGQPPIGFVNPALYALGNGGTPASYFHDIISGNNFTTASPSQFAAKPGFDLCTGFGTPVVSALIDTLSVADALGVTPADGFEASGPVGGPFNTNQIVLSLTNSGAASIQWAMASLPAWLTASETGGVLPQGGGSTPVTVGLSAAAAAQAAGVYTATVAITNLDSGFVATRTISLSAGQNIVLNGDFETGDFAYWRLNGTTADQFNSVDNGSIVPVHSGQYSAALGQNIASAGGPSTLYQTLATVPGQAYALTFWLSCVGDQTGATTPNQMTVEWNGTALYTARNSAAFDWTIYNYTVLAASEASTLSFISSNDPNAWGLDDVTAVPIAAPVIQSVAKNNQGVSVGFSTIGGARYQVQSTDSLSAGTWGNLGPVQTGTGATLLNTDTTPAGGVRFYRVVFAP